MRCEGWANMSAFCAMIDDDRRLRAAECRNGERQWFQLRLSKDVTVWLCWCDCTCVCLPSPNTHTHTSSSAPLPLTTWAAQSRRLYSWCCKLKIFDFYATIRQRNDAETSKAESGWQDGRIAGWVDIRICSQTIPCRIPRLLAVTCQVGLAQVCHGIAATTQHHALGM